MPVVIIRVAQAVERVVGRACDLQHHHQQGYLNSEAYNRQGNGFRSLIDATSQRLLQLVGPPTKLCCTIGDISAVRPFAAA